MDKKKYHITLSTGQRITADEEQTVLQVLTDCGIPLRSDCGGNGVCGKCLVQVDRPSESSSTDTPKASTCHKACELSIEEDMHLSIPESSIEQVEVVLKPDFNHQQKKPLTQLNLSTSPGKYGLAIDLGTTTIAAFLCDMERGVVLNSGAIKNPQFIYGADVISRIDAAASRLKNLTNLQKIAAGAIQHLGVSLSGQQQIHPEKIQKIMVTGNSTMTHLLLGVDPAPIGVSPFKPAFTESKSVPASELGLFFHPNASLHTLPLISGFLGSDIIAAALAIDIDKTSETVMVLDVGTNGEIMVHAGGALYATSCATGPAFEGAAITHGVLAISGAIDAISLHPKNIGADGAEINEYDVTCSLIQHNRKRPKRAAGICGSGIVSAAAALYRTGLIEPTGRFSYRSDKPGNPLNFKRNSNGVLEFSLVPGHETQSGKEIAITQKDVRAIQLAKGAISTGIASLCREIGISHPDHIYIAGAFGNFLDKKDAMAIGMLPKLEDRMIEAVGNAAGEGAIHALLDKDVVERARDIAARTRVFDLAGHPDFQQAFTQSLMFP